MGLSLGLTSQSNDFTPFFIIDPRMLDPYIKVYRSRFCRRLFRLAVLVGRVRKRSIHRLCVPLKRVHARSNIRVKLEPLTFSKATCKEMTK